MPAIKIQDKRSGGFLTFDLRDILAVIGEPVLKSRWRCYDLCFTVKRDGEFYEVRESRLKLSGADIMAFALDIIQTIDGRFEAKSEGATKYPWLVIVAFDSSWFEVWSSKPWVIEKLKAHFENTIDITDISGILSEPVKVL